MLQNKIYVQSQQNEIPSMPDIVQQAPIILNNIQETVDKFEQVVDDIKTKVADNNLKQTVITNQQKTQFLNYAAQLYQTLDETVNQIKPINLIGSVILQLEAISEKCIQGKKQGTVRQDLVYNESINYLQNRRVDMITDDMKTLLRGMIELTFKCYENRLTKIFDDLFEVTKGCLQGCQQMSGVLQGVIPSIK